MSNRSLIEFNHDYVHMIEKDPETFLKSLGQYLRGGHIMISDNGRGYVFAGVRVFGMRHHSAGFDIKWGGVKASEPQDNQPSDHEIAGTPGGLK